MVRKCCRGRCGEVYVLPTQVKCKAGWGISSSRPTTVAQGPVARRSTGERWAGRVESLHVEGIDRATLEGVDGALVLEVNEGSEHDFAGANFREELLVCHCWAGCGFRIFAHILRKGHTYIKVSQSGSQPTAPARRRRRPTRGGETHLGKCLYIGDPFHIQEVIQYGRHN